MPLSADEIRQSFFGEHGIAAENSEYLLRQFFPKDRDAYFDDIRNTQPACKWLFESEHGEEARRLLWEIFNTPKNLICAVIHKADATCRVLQSNPRPNWVLRSSKIISIKASAFPRFPC